MQYLSVAVAVEVLETQEAIWLLTLQEVLEELLVLLVVEEQLFRAGFHLQHLL
jgi:hypothetical protein